MCAWVAEQAAGLLPILTVSSDSRRAALAAWEASLDGLRYPHSLRFVVHLGESNPPPGYCTASWALAHERKLQEVIGYLTAHRGRRVILADLGIKFFPAFIQAQPRWLRMMDSGNLDMLFMRERGHELAELREGEVSTRLVVIHSTEPALRFWNQVLQNQLAEPRMASYLPYSVQHHVNNLLTYFAGGGPQDGAHGASWDYLPDEDVLTFEPSEGQDLSRVAVCAPLGAKVPAQQLVETGGTSAPTFAALEEAEARAKADAEVGRIASEIRRLRQELASNPQGQLERYRAALALAAAQLLVEVEALAGRGTAEPTALSIGAEKKAVAAPIQVDDFETVD
uniref:Nucleotide-diphospho-sugar transferase domain-containing protein n=1 Tax=Alexandrium monilatum TaxID=311494 RepID=A0A7S4PRY7_9DINO|mmetsp:Transcript_110887/g.346965  ORF Transcript_110887/g.346965 Transcript_110887/m.346965 type:complete len:339 (+) Transcript_110887:103-1119(+)